MGSPVAEYNLNPIQSDGRVVAGANVITPLETLLTQQLTIQMDDENAKIYPFAFCVQMGCVARIGLTQDDLDSYRCRRAGNRSQCFQPRPQPSPNASHYL
jgi:invasion protein IalB